MRRLQKSSRSTPGGAREQRLPKSPDLRGLGDLGGLRAASGIRPSSPEAWEILRAKNALRMTNLNAYTSASSRYVKKMLVLTCKNP
jgi:hypothetical protein